jgi:hypothetical protein
MLAGNTTPKRSDAKASVRLTISDADIATAETSKVLAQAFACVSRMELPQVQEPIELLWRIARQRKANEEKMS